MGRHVLERGADRVGQLWRERPGRPPVYVEPLSRFAEFFGTEYDWGSDSLGAYLTGCMLVYSAGYTTGAARFVGPYFAREVLAKCVSSRVVWEDEVLHNVVAHTACSHMRELAEHLIHRRRARRGQ